MLVTRKMVVTIEFVVKNEKGEVLDSSEKSGKLSYLHGFRNIVEGLEEVLEGKQIGETFSVSVPVEKAYGPRDENMIFTVPKEKFITEENPEVKVGMEFDITVEDAPYIMTVVEIDGDTVKIDANHPLAGKPLYFDGKVTDIRKSYSDELVQGYPIKEEE